jgi:peptide/nickel transport system permease protein
MAGSTRESAIADLITDPDIAAQRVSGGGALGPAGAPLGKARTSVSPWREAWRRFKRHRLAYWSLWVLAVLVLAVLLGPLVYKVGINEVDFKARLAGPSLTHPFGTDDLGRDILARVLYGGRISLAVGMAAMLMAITVGVIIGAIAGMARGWLDAALMWVTDLFLSLPQLPLLLLLIFLFREPLKQTFGLEVGIFILIVLVIGGFRWMPVARLVRAQFFSLREKEFVEAARALGASTRRQVLRHILPNSRSWAWAFRPTSRPGGASSTTAATTWTSRCTGRSSPASRSSSPC